MTEESLLAAVLERKTPAERVAYLDEACTGDAALRRRVEALLKAHYEAGGLLEPPAGAAAVTGDHLARPSPRPIAEGPGIHIGPYKLLQTLGEGGMGAVFLADQEQPVRRKVALKIIKAGMDTAQVLARFEAERQALAMMDHPHIAKVLDAGTTDAGRPYFVMELVKGIPITKYCDQEHLTPKERLDLFIPVCQAVQHAHQKGVIHRDLKPSNVLIALYDGQPVPKVIDFGVAKATSQKLTERTMFTEVGTILGTLEYMAPEQAELNNLDIDTRADVYSLGVLLYELLTGSPPFTAKQLRGAAYSEMMRLIREVDPPKPSTRLSGSEDLPSIAARRKLEPARLTRLVQGDLDWIAMKALEKDRGRRYETANGFARDIQRYLHDEPVEARPPSAGYRLRKFLKRNKGPVLAAALVFLALVGGTVGTSVGLVRAARAERRANKERDRAEANFRQARRAVDDYFTQVSEDTLLNSPLPGLQPLRKNLLATALKYYEDFAEERATDPGLRAELAAAYYRVGDITSEIGMKTEALEALRRARGLYEELTAADPADPALKNELAKSLRREADLLGETGHRTEAVESYRRALAIGEALVGANPENTTFQSELARSHRQFGRRSHLVGRPTEALKAYQRAIDLGEKLRQARPDDPRLQRDLAECYIQACRLHQETGEVRQALQSGRLALSIADSLAHGQPYNGEFQANLAKCWFELGLSQRIDGLRELKIHGTGNRSLDPALGSFKQAILIWEKLVRENPAVTQYRFELGISCSTLANLQSDMGLLPDALAPAEQGRTLLATLEREDRGNRQVRHQLAFALGVLGKVQEKLGRVAEALESYDQSAVMLTEAASAEPMMSNYNLACALSLGGSLVGRGKTELTAAEQARRTRYADGAMEALRRSVAAGFNSVNEMKADPDLELLRSREDFRRLVRDLEGRFSPDPGKGRKEEPSANRATPHGGSQ